MRRTVVVLAVSILVLSAGCVGGGGQSENAANPPQEDGSAGTGDGPETTDGEPGAVRFVETGEEPANHSAVLEYDELGSEQRALFESAVESNGTLRVTNDTTRRFVGFLRELSQPISDAGGLGSETVDPEVYVERNGTRYRVEMVRGATP